MAKITKKTEKEKKGKGTGEEWRGEGKREKKGQEKDEFQTVARTEPGIQ